MLCQRKGGLVVKALARIQMWSQFPRWPQTPPVTFGQSPQRWFAKAHVTMRGETSQHVTESDINSENLPLPLAGPHPPSVAGALSRWQGPALAMYIQPDWKVATHSAGLTGDTWGLVFRGTGTHGSHWHWRELRVLSIAGKQAPKGLRWPL